MSMTTRELLNRAANTIDKHGLARGKAYDKETKAYCLGASLVEAATYGSPSKFHEKEYGLARNLLCGQLGISSSYDAMADYNDDFYTTKKGQIIYKHSPQDMVKALRSAATLSEEPNTKKNVSSSK